MQPILDVAHGDVLAHRRAGQAARDGADLLAVLVDLGALARGRPVDDEAHAAAVDAPAALALGSQLGVDDLSAVEPAGGAALLGDDPAQPRLDGGGGVVEVVAVQAHSRLEAEGVARGEAGELEPLGTRALEEVLRGEGGALEGRVGFPVEGELKAVLACVAAAADEDGVGLLAAGELEVGPDGVAKVQLGEVDGGGGGDDLLEDLGAAGALEGEEPGVVEGGPLHGAAKLAELLVKVLEVLLEAGAVGDDVVLLLAEAGDDGVVDDAAGLAPEEGGQLALHGALTAPVRGGDGLEEGGGVRPLEDVLDHVADVEEGGIGAGEVVGFLVGKGAVLDGEVVSGERDELALVREVKVVQRSLLELF